MPDKRYKDYIKLGGGLATSRNRLTLRTGDALVAENCNREHTDAVTKRNGNELLYRFVDAAGTPLRVVAFYNHEWEYPCRGAIHRHLFVMENGDVYMLPPGDDFAPVQVYGPTLENIKTDRVSFVTVDGDTFIAVGRGRLRLFDGERLYWAGLDAPETGPATAAAAGSGALTGEFSYKITYIYETDETSRESGPSPKSTFGGVTATITVASKDVDLTWTAHPNATDPGNGERCNGYRIYRTVDLSASTADSEAYLLVTEINDVTQTTYTDSKPSTELTDLAPVARPRPPDGTRELGYHSDSLFCGSPRFNPGGYAFSTSGDPEYFPTANSRKVPDSSVSAITGFFRIAGTFGYFTVNEIYHINGSSPADFVDRQVSSFTGCLAPDSIVVFNDVVSFVGKHGIYSWDGSRPAQLTEDIEDDIKGLPFSLYRQSHAVVYQERNHLMVSMLTKDGARVVRVLDYTAREVSMGDGADPDLAEPRATRAWFTYTGMQPTSMGVVRSYEDFEQILYWGDEQGNVYRYDRGDTDAGAPILMRYHYVFRPSEGRTANPIDRKFRVRSVSPKTDEFEGAARVGLQYLESHQPAMKFNPWRNRSFPVGQGRTTEERFSDNGEGAAIVALEHNGPGRFRVIGVSHTWQPLTRRHQEV